MLSAMGYLLVRQKTRIHHFLLAVFSMSVLPFSTVLGETGEAETELAAADAHALVIIAPASRWAVRLELRGNGWNQRYDDNGNLVAMGADFDQVALDNNVLPGLPPGLSLGTTSFSSNFSNRYGELAIGYGVTSDLTVGVLLPFGQTTNNVNFAVNGGNVGFNPAFDPGLPVGPANFPFAPVGAGVTPLGTEGVQEVLTNPAFGFAYQRIASTTTSGLSDPTLGLLWRFYRGNNDSLVLGLGYRFGIAKADDPDNLMDFPVGDGSDDLRAQLEYFRNLGANFDLRLLIDRKIQLADTITARVPAPGQLLASADSKQTLDRDLGDFWEYDIELGRSWSNWRGSATWHRYDKEADRYSSNQGSDVSALEANTRTYADQWRASISWSGINAWRRGDIVLPLIVRLEMQQTYRGRNFINVKDIYLRITSFF